MPALGYNSVESQKLCGLSAECMVYSLFDDCLMNNDIMANPPALIQFCIFSLDQKQEYHLTWP